MNILHCSDTLADVYLGSRHFYVENVNDEFFIFENCDSFDGPRFIATVASMEIAIEYLRSFENYLD